MPINKIKLCLLITLMSFYHTFSQECGTTTPTSPEIYPDNPTTRNADTGSTFCVNVKIHLVRNDNGSNGYIGGESTNTDNIISKLNEYFNPQGIYLNKVGVNTINKTSFLDIDGSDEFNNLLATDNDPNAINYYVVRKLENLAGLALPAGVAKLGKNRLAIVRHRIFETPSAHEVGHCLNLYHTHETKFGIEAISGSNCSVAGDLVCDTPADPKLDYPDNEDSNCNYIGGGGYNPDTSNIMSYGLSTCIDGFSNGQGFRMRQALRYNSELQNMVSNSCTITDIAIDGTDAICLNQNKTFSLQNLPSGLIPYWSTTSNLNIISSNTTDITVNLPNNTSDTIIITAKLTIGGIDYYVSKNLTHLPVPSASSIELESFKSQPIYTNRWTNITARYNGLITLNNPNQRFEWKWVVPSHQIIQNDLFESYIHVNPLTTLTSVYIKTQAENECGCSDWKGKWFNIVTSPSNCSTCPTDPGEVHY